MFTEDKVTEIFCMADDFCKFFDTMMAMTDDCCLYFCGDGYGLEDFRKVMTMLVELENSQHSYKNTLMNEV